MFLYLPRTLSRDRPEEAERQRFESRKRKFGYTDGTDTLKCATSGKIRLRKGVVQLSPTHLNERMETQSRAVGCDEKLQRKDKAKVLSTVNSITWNQLGTISCTWQSS